MRYKMPIQPGCSVRCAAHAVLVTSNRAAIQTQVFCPQRGEAWQLSVTLLPTTNFWLLAQSKRGLPTNLDKTGPGSLLHCSGGFWQVLSCANRFFCVLSYFLKINYKIVI